MNLREVLLYICQEYPNAKKETFKNHKVANFIRQEVPLHIERSIAKTEELLIKASPGLGRWAEIPWIALLNKSVTDTTEDGYYPVYTFSSDFEEIYLMMGLGVNDIKNKNKKNWKVIIANKVDIIRKLIHEYKKDFTDKKIDIQRHGNQAKMYDLGMIFYKKYSTKNLPQDLDLKKDLENIINLYNILISRHELISPSPDTDDHELGNNISAFERKQFRQHLKVEGRANTKKIKTKLKDYCEVCGFNFREFYGELGDKFIEAHHLQPYSKLEPGQTRNLTVKDFAALCANCHRMIHRTKYPESLQNLKDIIQSQRTH